MSNEAELTAALENLGFQTFAASELSFADQVRLFSGAKVIVGPHGAGLANLIFARNPFVIELFGPSALPLNANLARGLGFRYGCLCDSEAPGGASGREADHVVDVDRLLDLLASMRCCP